MHKPEWQENPLRYTKVALSSNESGDQWPRMKSFLMEVWSSVQLRQNFFLVLRQSSQSKIEAFAEHYF